MKHNKIKAILLVGIGMITTGIAASSISTNISIDKASNVTYGLMLDDTNKINVSSVEEITRSITTRSNEYYVDFSYQNVSPSISGHCILNSGGIIRNSDHILSIDNILMTFETDFGLLRFRTSYDSVNWGAYNVAVSGQLVSLPSHPYYVEFSALNSAINITSISYSYTCVINPDAEVEGEQLLGVLDFWNSVNAGNTECADTVTKTYLDSFSFSDLAHSSSLTLVSSISSTRVYQKRYGGIGFGSSSAKGSLTLNINSLYKPDRIDIVGLKADNDGGALSIQGDSEATISLSFSVKRSGNASDIANAQTLSFSFENKVSTIVINSTAKRTAIYRILFYSSGSVAPIPKDEIGFVAEDLNFSNYTTTSIFNNDNSLIVKACFSDGSKINLSKGNGYDNYSYVVKDNNDIAIDTSLPFNKTGSYTCFVSYKKYIPIQIPFDVGEDAIRITSITAVLMEDNFETKDVFFIEDNILIDLVFSDSSTCGDLEYTDLVTYNIGLKLLNPASVEYDMNLPFGTPGDWVLRVYSIDNPLVYDDCPITVSPVHVSGVTITNGTLLTLEVGETVQLNVNVSPVDAGDKTVTWSSSNSSIATVSNSGFVSALSKGHCNIVARTNDGGFTATCSLTINSSSVTRYQLVTSTSELISGEQYIFASNLKNKTASISLTSGYLSAVDSTFSADKSMITSLGSETALFTLGGSSGSWTFTNQNGDVLSNITKNLSYNGSNTTWNISISSNNAIVSRVESGTTYYLCHNDGSPRFKTYAASQGDMQLYKVDGNPIFPTSIEVNPSSLLLGTGQTSTLTTIFSPLNANQTDVIWSSSNSAVVGVSNEGVVTGVSFGSARITATTKNENEEDIFDYCDVTVTSIGVSGVSISPSNTTLSIGDSKQLNVTVEPFNASNKNVNFASSNNAIASVSNVGLITANGVGNAVITVRTEDGGYEDTCSITVTSLAKTNLQYDINDYIDKSVYEISNCPTIGSPNLLIIPIWFTDSSSFITTNREIVRNDIEKAYLGTSEETGWHSVKSYYEEESNGDLTLGGTVANWYECGRSASYYGNDESDLTTTLVEEATNHYFATTDDSRTNYDFDNDGYLDGVILIYGAPDYSAWGKSSASYGNLWAYCFWIQDYDLKNVSYPGPNVFFWASYDFMYGREKAKSKTGTNYSNGDTSHTSLDAHTYIHEMGHVFGIEDYYDYSGDYEPAGGFSMQDYNVGGHDPYSVMSFGWADPYIPNESTTITIGAFQTTKEIILLTPSFNSSNSPFDEYLLLELYTPTGLNKLDSDYRYDSTYPLGPSAVGIRLWHVDSRLLLFNSDGTSTGTYSSNPYYASNKYVLFMMSNSYSGDHASVLGSSYYNYNHNQLIRNNVNETYKPTSCITNADLFQNGSSFNISTFSKQFVKGTSFNNSSSFNWSFTVSISGTGASARATISLIKS